MAIDTILSTVCPRGEQIHLLIIRKISNSARLKTSLKTETHTYTLYNQMIKTMICSDCQKKKNIFYAASLQVFYIAVSPHYTPE